MGGTQEMGTCKVCGEKDVVLSRKYYYYDIPCDCCEATHQGKKVHFEIVWHCKDCEPKQPKTITLFPKKENCLD